MEVINHIFMDQPIVQNIRQDADEQPRRNNGLVIAAIIIIALIALFALGGNFNQSGGKGSNSTGSTQNSGGQQGTNIEGSGQGSVSVPSGQ